MPITSSVWKRPFKGNLTDVGPNGNTQFISDVTALQDGGYFTATINRNRANNSGGDDVIVSRYDMLGNLATVTLGSSPATTELGTGFTSGNANQASLATLTNGTVVMAYVHTTTGGVSTIYVQRFSASGSASGFQQINEPAAGQTLGAPSITELAGGAYMVAYTVRVSATDTDIVGRVVSSAGIVGAAFDIFNQTDQTVNPQLATLTDGNVVAVYEDQFGGSTTDIDVKYSIISSAGVPTLTGTAVDGGGSGNKDVDASVAALRGGGFVVTFTTRAQTGGNDDVRWATYTNVGTAIANGAVTTSAANENESSVTALADGGFMVTWENDTTQRTMGQRYDASGGAVGPQMDFDGRGGFGSPDIETLRDGRVIVATSTSTTNDVSLSIWDPDRDMFDFGDFNGDGKADVLSRNAATSEITVRTMDGTSFLQTGAAIATNASLKLSGIGDFDGDNKADILWRAADGTLYVTLMDGTLAKAGGSPGGSNVNFKIAGVDDFDGDGKADLLWRGNDGTLYITLMNGLAFKSGATLGPTNQQLSIMATGDMDGDGKADILWRGNDASLYITLMNGQAYKAGGSPGASGLRWNFEGLADLDGDGKADILWRDTSDGSLAVTLMDGLAFKAGGVPGVSNLGLHVAGLGDFNGDGKADIFWKSNATSGGAYSTAVTLMNGTAFLGGGGPGALPSITDIAGDQHNFVL